MLVKKSFYEPTESGKAKALPLLIEAARSLTRDLSIDSVSAAALLEAKRVLNALAAWILLYDPKEDLLKMHRYWGPREDLFNDVSIRSGVGVAGKVLLTQRPEVVIEPDQHPASMFYQKGLSKDIPAIAVYPITVEGKRLGILGISCRKEDLAKDTGSGFDPVKALTMLVAVALDISMRFDEKGKSEGKLKRNIKSLQMLNEIGIDLVSDLDLRVIMQKVAQYTADILDADAAVINLFNKEGTSVDEVYLHNMPPKTEELLLTRRTIARAVLENPCRILINEYPDYPEAITEFVEAGLRSIILVPVVSKGSLLATLSAISFSDNRTFSEDDFDNIEFVARQVAIAVEDAKLYGEQIELRKKMEAYAGQLRLLNEFSRTITKEKEPRKMGAKLAASARSLLDCTAVAVLLFRERGWHDPIFAWSADAIEPFSVDHKGIEAMTSSGLHGKWVGSKSPVRVTNIKNHPDAAQIPDNHPMVNDLLSMPLLDSDGNLLGQVMATDKRDGSDFTQTDEDLLSALCAQVAIGIEKAEAYEREHRIAETLQQAILAVPSELPGIEVGITYESAAEATKVGGDFYDLFELQDGKVGLLVGDVSGKGLEAATITSMVKSTIRAFAYKTFSPAAVLTEANKVICEQLKLNQFVTMVYGVIDPCDGTLTMARAGHPELLVWCGSRCVQRETESNLPVGVVPDVAFEENEIKLTRDNIIIFYTDGLTEAKCDNLLLGEDRIIERLNQVIPGKHPQQITAEMVRIAKEFTGGRLQDDVAIVALRLNRQD